MTDRNTPVSETGLSEAVVNALRNTAFFTVQDLLTVKKESFRYLPGLTFTGLLELLEKKADLELEFNRSGKDSMALLNDSGRLTMDGRLIAYAYFRQNPVSTAELEALSARAFNILWMNDVRLVQSLVLFSKDDLMRLPRMNIALASEIEETVSEYVQSRQDEIKEEWNNSEPEEADETDHPAEQETSGDDVSEVSPETPIADLNISNRSRNFLRRAGYSVLNEILPMTMENLMDLPGLGRTTAEEIYTYTRNWLRQHGLLQETEEPEEYIENSFTFDDADYEVSPETSIENLNLSNRSKNSLQRAGYTVLGEILPLKMEELCELRNLGKKSAEEIYTYARGWLNYRESHPMIIEPEEKEKDIFWYVNNPEYREKILSYAMDNDEIIEDLLLSVRAKHCLHNAGYMKRSEILFLNNDELSQLPGAGAKSLNEIREEQKKYFTSHADELMAYCTGEMIRTFSDEKIMSRILDLYKDNVFGGYSFEEIMFRLALPEEYDASYLKGIIGRMIAEKKLEYVDFRCYRIYSRFTDYADQISGRLDERNLAMLKRKLGGDTLQAIGDAFGVTRERVRQIINKTFTRISDCYRAETGVSCFDEDYYRYFYETYSVDTHDYPDWFGISSETLRYLTLMDVKQGKRDIAEAQDDKTLDYALRIRARNYLNRNKIFVSGIWVEKRRGVLEDLVLREKCRDEMSYDQFIDTYNSFLTDNGIPYDPKIYITEEVRPTRSNRLAESRCVLWKVFQMMRYYDIEGRDFSELLDSLNLDAFENTEISTRKLMNDHPDLMVKYDIRDPHELHNLLKKILPDHSYHDLKFGRMPHLIFGDSNINDQIHDLMTNNSPISLSDFADLVYEEYGFEKSTFILNYLKPYDKYYHNGIFRIDQKEMAEDRLQALDHALTDDFYYFDEIKEKYLSLYPAADSEEINPLNLKRMGFLVLSRYALRNHDSLEAYIRSLLTSGDIVDIAPYRKRFGSVVTFSNTLWDMKRAWEIIEFEPDRIITGKHLAAGGITGKDLRQFCDDVYEFAPEGSYFTIHSLLQQGFESDLFDMGFSDWFYSNVLVADERFSFTRAFGNYIFIKGKQDVTLRSFVEERINFYGSIDVYDLLNELTDTYGMSVKDRLDPVYKAEGSAIYYDSYLDRVYASEELYFRELDSAEE